MTRQTALALIRRIDLNNTLAAAGKLRTRVDIEEYTELLAQADVEDALGLREPINLPLRRHRWSGASRAPGTRR
jgi:hypothetical protein